MDAEDMARIAEARLQDAKCLLSKSRCLAAVYLAGYTVELRLKWAILQRQHRGWMTTKACKDLGHDLQALFRESQVNQRLTRNPDATIIQARHTVAEWNSEIRYDPPDKIKRKWTMESSQRFVDAAEVLSRWIQDTF